MKTRIMWIEHKCGESGLAGPARIGRVTVTKSGKSLRYAGRLFRSLGGRGFKANYADAETGEEYWISGCHRDGREALYATEVEIDKEVREEYWREIRNKPGMAHVDRLRVPGKYTR